MNEDIEALVLSGKLFNSDPERTPSPDAGWHDEELKHRRDSSHLEFGDTDESDDDDDEDSGAVRPRVPGSRLRQEPAAKESIGMGPGRTGVKGVIRDREEALAREFERHRREIDDLNRRFERENLGGKTYLEEEREKALDPTYEGKIDELILKERERTLELQAEKRDIFGRRREGRFGHLREVGIEGFVASVEEDKGIYVVVHIYDPSLGRCEDLDDTLMRLAPLYPTVKFIHARASTLGFASSSKPLRKGGRSYGYHHLRTNGYDEKRGGDEDEDEDDSGNEGTQVDLDMLPTLLVYRDGELVHNWVRVDWEAGPAGVEDLLERHQILPPKRSYVENLGFPPDGPDDISDDDLNWSDSDVM